MSRLLCAVLMFIADIFATGRSFYFFNNQFFDTVVMKPKHSIYSLYPSKDSFYYKCHILTALQTWLNFCLYWNMIPDK